VGHRSRHNATTPTGGPKRKPHQATGREKPVAVRLPSECLQALPLIRVEERKQARVRITRPCPPPDATRSRIGKTDPVRARPIGRFIGA
jgi:hypothetical protein